MGLKDVASGASVRVPRRWERIRATAHPLCGTLARAVLIRIGASTLTQPVDFKVLSVPDIARGRCRRFQIL